MLQPNVDQLQGAAILVLDDATGDKLLRRQAGARINDGLGKHKQGHRHQELRVAAKSAKKLVATRPPPVKCP